MGERERVAALSHPVTRGGVGERSAPRPLRRKPNSSPERPHQLRRKSKSPPAQPHGRAREGRTLSHPVPRGDVGERRAPRPLRRNPNSSPERPHQLRRKSKSPPEQPHGRAREGVNPLAPRRPPHQKRASPAKRPSDSSPSLYQPCGKDASNPDTNRAYPRAFHVRPPPYPTFSTIYPQPPVWKILKNCRFTLE